MNRSGHCDSHFAFGDLYLRADLHDVFALRLLCRKIGELYQIRRQLGIADKNCVSLACDRNRIADVIAMSMREQNVISSVNRDQSVFAVFRLRINRIINPWIDQYYPPPGSGNAEGCVTKPLELCVLRLGGDSSCAAQHYGGSRDKWEQAQPNCEPRRQQFSHDDFLRRIDSLTH